MNSTRKKLYDQFMKYFLEGLVILVPFVFTVWAVVKTFTKLHNMLLHLVSYIPILSIATYIPGLGIVMACLVITLLGYIASHFLIRSLINFLERFVLSIPLVDILYSYIKESTSAFIDKFDEPVLVTVNHTLGIQKIGFVTQHNLATLALELEDKIAVYIPHSYSFSGELNLVSKAHVVPIKVAKTKILRFIVSGGLSEIKELPVTIA
jgi:uncharacterized membrane protein